MITLFICAVVFTLGVSAFCSLLEAMILSTTPSEIEGLRKKSPLRGELLDRFRTDIEETSSAILSLNTVANTFGATMTGVLAARIWEGTTFLVQWGVPIGMTLGILVLSEIVPKNMGVFYRPAIQPYMVYPLHGVRLLMRPFSFFFKKLVNMLARRKDVPIENDDEEIILLAEKSAKDGTITSDESNMVTNALSLDDVQIREIMTPRTVVTALAKESTVAEVCNGLKNLPHARMPVYEESIDHVVGLVRRRDLLRTLANEEGEKQVGDLMHETLFVPENATAAQTLQQFLQNHQQLAVVVDEYGSVAGVVTMEDIMEYILGQEIFEKDDVAIDMRELAHRKRMASARRNTRTATHDVRKSFSA